jgi:hypothetical protein
MKCGVLPTALCALDEHQELVWLGKLFAEWNRDLELSLTTIEATGSMLAAIRKTEDEEDRTKFAILGASTRKRA